MSVAVSAPSGLDLSHRAKVYVGVCFLLSTIATAGINGWVNVHFGAVQADQASKKADVRKFEDQISEFDQLVRQYMKGLNKDEPSDVRREAILTNAQAQYLFLGSLIATAPPEQQSVIEKYRSRLVSLSAALRDSEDIPSTQAFAQAVSYAVDEREAALKILRRSAGLQVTA